MAAPLDTSVAIETPEHIVFHYRVAGPARRALAHLIDLALCYGALAALAASVIVIAGSVEGAAGALAKAGVGLVLLALFVVQWLYFVVWEGLLGRTPGKMGAGMRVVTTAGRPIGFGAAALRNLLRAADLLPLAYLTGVVSMALSSRFQRLGDLVAGTMVVVLVDAHRARPIELAPPAAPHELATLPDEIRLDAEERAALELFLRSHRALGAARAHELAAMIARPLGDRVGFTHADPTRLLALVYDRAVNAGRTEAPPSSLVPSTPPPGGVR